MCAYTARVRAPVPAYNNRGIARKPRGPGRRHRRLRPGHRARPAGRQRPTTTGAMPAKTRATWPAPSPTTTRPSPSTRSTPRPTTTGALPAKTKGDLAGAIADYDQAIALNPQDATAYNNRGAARQPRRPGRRHRRLRPGHRAQPAGRHGLQQPGDCPPGARRPGRRHRRLRPGHRPRPAGQPRPTTTGALPARPGDLAGAIADYDQAIALNPQVRRGLQQPGHCPPGARATWPAPRRLRPGHRARPAGTPRPTTTGALPARLKATWPAPSPTTTRPSPSTRRTPGLQQPGECPQGPRRPGRRPRRLRPGHRPRPPGRHGLQQPGDCPRRPRRPGRRPRRLRPGHRPQPRRTPRPTTTGGIAREAQGDLAGALADYDQAIALNPQDATAYNNRGIARADQGDLAGALADYDQAIALNPQDATAYNNRGNARQAQGDLAGALADYDQAIALNPQVRHGLQQPGECPPSPRRPGRRPRRLRPGHRPQPAGRHGLQQPG